MSIPSVADSRLVSTLALAVVICATFAASPVRADHVVDQVSFGLEDCDEPAVASSPTGLTMVAWVEEGGPIPLDFVVTRLVPTHPQPGIPLPDPVGVGPGHHPALCWSGEGFTVVFSSDPAVIAYQSDLAGSWDLENSTLWVPHDDIWGLHTIDLWGNSGDGAGAHVFLVLGGTLYVPGQEHEIHFAGRTEAGWSDLELVSGGAQGGAWPRVTYATGPYGPLPRVFFLAVGGTGELVHTTRTFDSGWTEPAAVPGAGGAPCPVGSEFDVAAWDFDGIGVLGDAHQPTCPCNTIHYVEHADLGEWQDPVDLTVDHAELDWPLSPCVAAGTDGSVHAFWYQQGANGLMEPVARTLEYWVQDEGVWSEAGAFLDPYEGGGLGSRVALALAPDDEPVFAFTRLDTVDGEPQPRQVFLARPGAPVAVADELPVRKLQVTAWPNPFNPRVQIGWTLDRADHVTTTVHDLRGRTLATLQDGRLAAGVHQRTWQGEDAAGRALPSGVYLVRVRSAGAVAAQKIVLER